VSEPAVAEATNGRSRALQFGMTLRGTDGIEASATRLESMGFDLLGSGEHVAFHVPTPNNFISLAVAAGVTERIRLLSAVTLLPLYPPVLAAKLGAALDVASGGRFVMGVGVGGEYPREFEACGIPVHERGARANEALALIRRLWTEPAVTFQGRFTTCEDITIAPSPLQRPHPPIWVSGRKAAAMRRAARHGDGWMPYMYAPEQLRASIGTIAAHCAELGRSPDEITNAVYLFTCVHPDRDTAIGHAVTALGRTYAQDFTTKAGRLTLVGTPAECRARLQEYLDAGATTVLFASACPGEYATTNQQLIRDELVAAFR
jgi:probable F420-dependent oxidoreductase